IAILLFAQNSRGVTAKAKPTKKRWKISKTRFVYMLRNEGVTHKTKGFGLLGIVMIMGIIALLAWSSFYVINLGSKKSQTEIGMDAIKQADELKQNIEKRAQESNDACEQFSISLLSSEVYVLGEGVLDKNFTDARLAMGAYDADGQYTGMAFKRSGSKFADIFVPAKASLRQTSETYSLSSIRGSQFRTFQGSRAAIIFPRETRSPIDIYMQSETPFVANLSINNVNANDGKVNPLVEKKSVNIPANDK